MGAALAAKLPAARAAVRSRRRHPRLRPARALHRRARPRSSTRPSTASRRCSSAASPALEQLKQDAPDAVDDCAATAGLSLGEYTALVFAGVMDFEAGLRVVQERGRAMQDAADATPSGMVSVLGLERDKSKSCATRPASGEVLEIANLLCPGNIVVSGSKAACERVATLAEAAGAMKVIPLAVAGAFHTSLMQPAVERLAAALANVEIRQAANSRDFRTSTPRPHDDPDEIRATARPAGRQPVLWEDSMRCLLGRHGVEKFYEIGPGRVLAGLLKRIDRKFPCENVAA